MTLFAVRINIAQFMEKNGELALIGFMLGVPLAAMINLRIIKTLTKDRSKRSTLRAILTISSTTLVGLIVSGVVYAISCSERGAPEDLTPQIILTGLCVLMGIGGYKNSAEEPCESTPK